VALDHARRFSHQGWRVFVADSVSCRLSGWSDSVTQSVTLASPRFDPAGFVADLCRTIERHAIDLVVPTCEEVFFVSRYRSALPASCRVLVDDFDKLRLLHSKWDFLALARECGGNPPPSATVGSIAEAREWSAKRPLVLKPEFSRFGVNVRLYSGGMPATAPELPERGRWVAQAYCQGVELCSYSIADKGRLLAHAVYRGKHRLRRSASYYFEHHDSPAIRAFVENLVARIGFTGQISFDWIDSGTGQPSVIECNPRAISGLHLFSIDDALPAALSGANDGCIVPSTPLPRMIGPVMLGAGLFQALQGGGSLRHWWNDLYAARDVVAIAGDRAPVFGGLVDLCAYMHLSFRQKCTMREAATRDIEWDGEELVPV
jgi:hypothetical protein